MRTIHLLVARRLVVEHTKLHIPADDLQVTIEIGEKVVELRAWCPSCKDFCKPVEVTEP